MILAIVLAIQGPASATLPAQMEPAVVGYTRCLTGQIDRQIATLLDKPAMVPKVHAEARAACADVRAQSITSADGALAALPAFADATQRRGFVARWFDDVDRAMGETFSGGSAPDKREQ